MDDLYQDLQDLINRLNQGIKLMGRYGREYAIAEQDYKVELRKVALKLRAEKDMPVTLINNVVYGEPTVADKRCKKDIAEAMYKTAQENINSIKLQIRVIENQIGREWGNNYEQG